MPTPKERLENLAKLQKELLATKRDAEELSLRITIMLEHAAEEEARLAQQVVDKPQNRQDGSSAKRPRTQKRR
jgi:hypothetical protein